jgi:hypothetical protein
MTLVEVLKTIFVLVCGIVTTLLGPLAWFFGLYMAVYGIIAMVRGRISLTRRRPLEGPWAVRTGFVCVAIGIGFLLYTQIMGAIFFDR